MTTLYAFRNTPDAGSPYGGLVAGASGNLYGTTYEGGANGLGAVYELISEGARYRERVLYSFRGGSDGSASTSTLIFGAPGVLYGTTSAGGGSCDCGTIFSLNVKSKKEQVLHAFGSGADGAYPYYGMTMDSRGNFSAQRSPAEAPVKASSSSSRPSVTRPGRGSARRPSHLARTCAGIHVVFLRIVK